MATESDLASFLDDLKEDAKFKKFRLILKNTREKMKIERDRAEALGLMANRTSRSLHGRKQFSPKSLLEATSNDLSARARLVEIRVRAKVNIDLLVEACDALRNHIYTEYADEIRQFGSSAEQRKALVERVQGTARTMIVEANAMIDMLDQIIKDIDSASHHLRHMVDVLKLLDGSKGKIV
ncbi:hypothetical protein BcepSauron_305 [Burkholderia phage BcepSauron]|uniref:Uncharacterized protein n=2 Tax=Sarumanvirus TaxID=2843450 RepID=A0A482MLZ5_9CAUD|nr:hypothetical protein H1O16_gp304 [Burkholderia phage BcepSaruman]YP_009904683.1 hypothetical protein H1O17_gp305 [Burkholderia phage BcepSauron]QBQ74685.1 hypothetical protein BcepSauron_305 [Burkholderia phage BcepSauron]QBX06717.1 hypothetical protein BcepSaruman_304 [Burkholderia phage BcepSaruman]